MRRSGIQPRCKELHVAGLGARSVVVVTLLVNGVLRNSCSVISE